MAQTLFTLLGIQHRERQTQSLPFPQCTFYRQTLEIIKKQIYK